MKSPILNEFGSSEIRENERKVLTVVKYLCLFLISFFLFFDILVSLEVLEVCNLFQMNIFVNLSSLKFILVYYLSKFLHIGLCCLPASGEQEGSQYSLLCNRSPGC